MEEEPQNVDKQIAAVEEPLEVVQPQVASPEVQKVFQQIPELIQAVAKEQIIRDAIAIAEVDNNTEAVDIPQEVETIVAAQLDNAEGVVIPQGEELASLPNVSAIPFKLNLI